MMANSVNNAAKWAQIFLFGDSITQRCFSSDGCWGSHLADFVMRRCDVIPRGFSGYNTRCCKLILPSVLNAESAKDVVAMTIFLGANDANSFEKGRNQHVPLEEYGQNLKEMVDHCLSVGLRRDQVILITPPAFYQEAWDSHCADTPGKLDTVGSRTNEFASLYASMCCKVAEQMGTSLVDLHTEMMKNQDFKSYLLDGLHLSESGSLLLFDLLKPTIERLTSHIPDMLFPYWADIDNEDPDSVKKSLKNLHWL